MSFAPGSALQTSAPKQSKPFKPSAKQQFLINPSAMGPLPSGVTAQDLASPQFQPIPNSLPQTTQQPCAQQIQQIAIGQNFRPTAYGVANPSYSKTQQFVTPNMVAQQQQIVAVQQPQVQQFAVNPQFNPTAIGQKAVKYSTRQQFMAPGSPQILQNGNKYY